MASAAAAGVAAESRGATPSGQLLDAVSLPITIVAEPLPVVAPEKTVEASPPRRLIWLSERYAPGDSRLFSIVAAGDLMMGSNYPSRAALNPDIVPGVDAGNLIGTDLAGIFRNADLSFVNLEGTLFDGPDRLAKRCRNCFAFRSPESYAEILASLGIDAVSLANNHSGDFGAPGRKATISALKRAGVAAAGLRDGAPTATLTLRDGRTAGVIAFAPNSGTLDINNIAAAEKLVGALAASHDFTVVSFHGGAEGWDATRVPGKAEIYLGENRGAVELFAHRMIDAGASLVLGHGPHVPRALELYRGRLIAYSLGNFWTHNSMMNYAVSGLGPVVQTWLAPDGTLAGLEIHSTRQAGLGIPRSDPLDEAARYVLYLTKADYPATAARLNGRPPPLLAQPAPGKAAPGSRTKAPAALGGGLSPVRGASRFSAPQ